MAHFRLLSSISRYSFKSTKASIFNTRNATCRLECGLLGRHFRLAYSSGIGPDHIVKCPAGDITISTGITLSEYMMDGFGQHGDRTALVRIHNTLSI